MLRRIPSTSDGKPVDRLEASTRVFKPFRPPSVSKPADARVQPARKRKRVSYKGAGGDDDDDDDAKKKNKNDRFGDQGPPPDNTQHFPVYTPKPFDENAARRFAIPVMTRDGAVVPVVQTNIALGIRPPVNVIPRPLHDPMEDHAIVLYDPTVDGRETDEERKERLREEARKKAEEDAQQKAVGLWNPHKSLKDMLGGGKDKAKHNDKVPVVIDPRLCKVLRPHQIEGVKVRSDRCIHSPCLLSCD
jgi:DNA repair and recombination RAD54-like protein